METKIIERARFLESTKMINNEVAEIGIDDNRNKIIISKYSPDVECSYYIEDFCDVNDVDMDKLARLLNDADIYYVL